MSRLKDNVPELELCKKIPEGHFDDSALVHTANGVYPRTIITDGGVEHFYCGVPAPTLAEIMEELPKYDENEKTLACIPDFPNESGEAVFGAAWTVGYTKNSSVTDKNPATAALKLWLKLKGVEG